MVGPQGTPPNVGSSTVGSFQAFLPHAPGMLELGNTGAADFTALPADVPILPPLQQRADLITLVKCLPFVLIVDLALKFYIFSSSFPVECVGFK